MWSQLDSDRRLQSPNLLNDVIKKYEGKAEFLFVYGPEINPEPDGPLEIGPDNFRNRIPDFEDLPPLVQTGSWDERAKRAALFAQRTKTLRHMLVDEDGDRSVSHLYEADHLQTIVVGLDGRIALRRTTIPVKNLDDFLQECLSQEKPG
jgi:hypothetical protein